MNEQEIIEMVADNLDIRLSDLNQEYFLMIEEIGAQMPALQEEIKSLDKQASSIPKQNWLLETFFLVILSFFLLLL